MVLIICILYAVALPQYQKAVFKARMAEAFTNLKTISEAVKLCELENGRIEHGINQTCHAKENLAISIGEEDDDAINFFMTDNFQYNIDREGLSGTDEIVANAYARDYDVCVCIYDDGHFVTNNIVDECSFGIYPNFDVAKALNLPVDENCACC
ncbi:MAG: hypothetical protein IJ311_03860 [Elusimicrobiaceae bacterium]|nr:hypothetical protein [Elusimicrobiaceae bacterium]